MAGGVRVGRRLRAAGLVVVAAALHVPRAAAHPVYAQASAGAGRDSARADSLRRALRSGMIPAGFGSLRQDDIAVRVQSLGLTVRAIPLEESVIRTLAPDTYGSLHQIREDKAKALEALRSRLGLESVQAWYVEFFNVEQGEARFDPRDVLVRSVGRDFRPLDLFPMTAAFGDGRLPQRGRQSAVYAFDPAVDLTQPLTVTIGTQQSSAWGDILQRIERERAAVWSRAGGRKPEGAALGTSCAFRHPALLTPHAPRRTPT